MKRFALVVLIVLTVAIPAVFASGIEVEMRAIPYQLQKILYVEDGHSESSVQGFGGLTGIKYVTDKGFDVGLEVELDSFTFKREEGYMTTFDGLVFAKVGIATPIDARVGFELDLAGGIDMYSDPEEGFKIYPTAKVGIGLRLKCLENTDGFCLVFGAAMGLEWEKDNWVDYSFAPYFGADFKL